MSQVPNIPQLFSSNKQKLKTDDNQASIVPKIGFR